jgi:uncharacterized protein (TIGR03437 family)
MVLYLGASDEQHRSLSKFLGEIQNPSSSNFRKFLSPEEYADRFGVSPSDFSTARSWLESQGFTIAQAARARTWILFQGTAEQASRAFQTEIHRYRVGGRPHYANAGGISIPEAISNLAIGVGGLDDFFLEPQIRVLPELTNPSGSHSLAPDDLATIYDIAALYKAGIDGSGQKIAIIGSRSMNAADIAAFQARFNLPSKVPQSILVPGFPDPGQNGSEPATETALDLEWAGAVARNADLLYVYSISPLLAIAYAIDQNLAPIVSLSYAGCETLQAASSLTFFQQLAQQANAQGITWVAASGDTGAAGCDPNGYPIAQNGLAVSFPANIPEVVAVGGTQFDEQSAGGTYWNLINDANGSSAMSYIPERAWNESVTYGSLASGGGGASVIFPKPGWQTGPGVPADGVRDVPDVSLTAAVHDGYAINVSGLATVVAGTSAGTPVFAGILALVNQYLQATGTQPQARLGNINPVLYRLAQTNPGTFHDIAAGGNNVPCASGSPSCANGTVGYLAGPGYDLATGLGSPDVFNLVHQWSGQIPKDSQVVVSLNQTPVYPLSSPDRNGFLWKVTVALDEENGVPTTLTDFTINGKSFLNTYFPQTSIAALGAVSATVGYSALSVPATLSFSFTGVDAGGTKWSRSVSVPFLPSPPVPTITGIANGASYDHAYAPGMFLSVFGTNLTTVTQITAAVPLESYLGGITATIGGIYSCPIYFVSPNQVNLQIPYEVPLGATTLSVSNGLGVAQFPLQISATAPGIFQDGSNSLVPNPSGARGQTYTLFMTGDGQVLPRVTDGSTPRSGISPAPVQNVTVTVGGVTAPTQFVGIPSWAIGMTQINFQVPPTAPLGNQQVIVTVGTASSSPVNFTVTP